MLVRPVNAAITFLSIGMGGVLAGWSHGQELALPAISLAGALIAAAGNIVNDLFDVEIDRINKPGRPMPAGIVSPKLATGTAISIAAAGLLITLIGGLVTFVISFAAVILLYAYNRALKRIPLLGNIVIGVLTGGAFLVGAAAVGDITRGLIPAVFACLFNIGREILKDIEDLPGDQAAGIRTLPSVRGIRDALRCASGVYFLMIALTPIPWLLFDYSMAYLLVVTVGVDLVVLISLYWTWNTQDSHTITHVSLLLKLDMIAGLFALLVH